MTEVNQATTPRASALARLFARFDVELDEDSRRSTLYVTDREWDLLGMGFPKAGGMDVYMYAGVQVIKKMPRRGDTGPKE